MTTELIDHTTIHFLALLAVIQLLLSTTETAVKLYMLIKNRNKK